MTPYGVTTKKGLNFSKTFLKKFLLLHFISNVLKYLRHLITFKFTQISFLLSGDDDDDDDEIRNDIMPVTEDSSDEDYFKGRNFHGKKLSRFRGFYPNPRKFLPAKVFKRRHPRKFLPAKFSKKVVICEYSEKNTLL